MNGNLNALIKVDCLTYQVGKDAVCTCVARNALKNEQTNKNPQKTMVGCGNPQVCSMKGYKRFGARI